MTSEIDSSVNTSSTAGVARQQYCVRMNTSVDQSLYNAPNGYTGGRGSITVKAQALRSRDLHKRTRTP